MPVPIEPLLSLTPAFRQVHGHPLLFQPFQLLNIDAPAITHAVALARFARTLIKQIALALLDPY